MLPFPSTSAWELDNYVIIEEEKPSLNQEKWLTRNPDIKQL